MGAFKKLNQQDVFVTTYVAKKSWAITKDEASDYGVEIYRGVSGSGEYYISNEDIFNGQYDRLVYQNINHSYFGNHHPSGDLSGSYNNFFETSFLTSSFQLENNTIAVISIAQPIYGTHIEPGTFQMQIGADSLDSWVDPEWVDPEWVIEGGYIAQDFLYDNGEYLVYSFLTGERVGYIIYSHGIVIIDSSTEADYIISEEYTSNYSIAWKSNQPIYTHNYICKVKDSDYNLTYNITAIDSSNGYLRPNVSGDSFSPYITTVGLYNDTNELMAVAKLNRPLPKSKNVDMVFEVKLDK